MLYVCKNLCWNFRQIGQKMKNYSLYKLSSCVTRGIYIYRPYRLASHTAYKGGGGRGGVMVKCIASSYGSCLLMLFLPSGAKETGIHGHQTSVTQETSWREVAQYVLLSADLSLASLSDISKHDCTEQKVDLFRNRWAYIAVFGLINSVTERHFDFYC